MEKANNEEERTVKSINKARSSKFSITIDKEISSSQNKKLSKEDFSFMKLLGKGAYAKVILAEFQGKRYALKIIDKKFVDKLEKKHEVHIEKQILSLLNHPRIVKLHSTFQDAKNLYFALDYCNNKDLAELLKSQVTLSCELSQFYAAEIVSALEYLRSQGVSHRDLKPENIVLDESMRIKLVSQYLNILNINAD